MLELCDYIYTNHPTFKNEAPRWRLLSLLDKNEDKIVFIVENNKLLSSGFYVKLDDKMFAKLKLGFVDMTNPDVVQGLLSEKGDNLHFLYAIGNGIKSLHKGIKKAIEKEKPKTISWYSRDMSKLNIKQMR